MLKNIHIKNYRGIKDLKIDDFKRINLFVGDNNSGKTSVLEAILLGTAPNILPIFHIINFREFGLHANLAQVDLSNQKLWQEAEYLIYEKNIKNGFTINSKFAKRTLELKVELKNEVELFPLTQEGLKGRSIFTAQDQINSLVACYSENNKPKTKLGFSRNGSYQDLDYSKDELKISIIQNRVIKAFELSYNEELKQLIDSNSEQEIVDVLSKIDPKIKWIKKSGDEIVCDIGKTSLPLKYMGDGIIQILNILLKIRNVKNGILLIDEIENCLHWKSQEALWHAIFEACEKFNVQIIATTHSSDIIKSLDKIYRKVTKNNKKFGEDNIRIFRIEKDDNGSQAIEFNAKMIEYLVEDNGEAR